MRRPLHSVSHALRRSPRPATGFTLVELLVALSVLSLLMVALYAGLRGAARSADGAHARERASEAMRATTRFVRTNIEHAAPFTRWRDGRWSLLFSGEPDRVTFVAPMPAHLGGGGLYEITLATRGPAGALQLAIERRLLHPDLDGTDTADLPAGIGDAAVLIDGLREVRFDYYGASRPGANADWRSRWEGEKRMPELVRLRIDPGKGSPWPELIIHPRTDLVRPLPRGAGDAPGAAAPAAEGG